MEATPLISVIVPVYNIKEYLSRCVTSIIGQSYEKLEILLVDDGSTDGTGILCDELAKQDQRIRVFHKENGGSSSARNFGIQNATGEFLGFVDSDDYIEADMYERLVGGIMTSGAEIAQIGRDEVDEAGCKLQNVCVPPAEDVFVESADFMKELLLHKGDCSFCTKLVKRELLEHKGFPEGVLNEDFHLLIQLLTRIKGIISLCGQAYHVFYRIGSNTRKKDRNEFSRVFGDNVDNADLVQQIVDETYPDLHDIAVRFGLFQRMDYMLHIPISMMHKENKQYISICNYLKKHIIDILTNKYLTKKNKVYLLLFATAPKSIRQVHGWSMRLRKGCNSFGTVVR
ncbi:MAG: glycosyltransferase [Lachnospiraceae bacterium]|nr:glycosyltransferase [Lachnospiraceae bacterium]